MDNTKKEYKDKEMQIIFDRLQNAVDRLQAIKVEPIFETK